MSYLFWSSLSSETSNIEPDRRVATPFGHAAFNNKAPSSRSAGASLWPFSISLFKHSDCNQRGDHNGRSRWSN
jgi:hypothetical protein